MCGGAKRTIATSTPINVPFRLFGRDFSRRHDLRVARSGFLLFFFFFGGGLLCWSFLFFSFRLFIPFFSFGAFSGASSLRP